MLDVRRLLVLHTVARHGSMTAAAVPLGYTPAAVSAHVAALERQAGTPLLERHRRGVRLTEAGALLVGHVEVVAERVERAEAELGDLLDLRAGRLRIVGFPSAAAFLLPDVVGVFHRAHPDVELSMDIRINTECPGLVASGAHDLAVVFDGYPGQRWETGDLQRRLLGEDPLTVALPADHPLADRPTVTLAELRDEAWVRDNSTDPACRDLLDHLAAEAGFVPRTAFDAADFTAAGRLVRAGVGVALIPELAAGQMPADVRLCSLDPPVSRRIQVLTPPSPTPAAAVLADLLAGRV